jgi:hypothetical protein
LYSSQPQGAPAFNEHAKIKLVVSSSFIGSFHNENYYSKVKNVNVARELLSTMLKGIQENGSIAPFILKLS